MSVRIKPAEIMIDDHSLEYRKRQKRYYNLRNFVETVFMRFGLYRRNNVPEIVTVNLQHKKSLDTKTLMTRLSSFSPQLVKAQEAMEKCAKAMAIACPDVLVPFAVLASEAEEVVMREVVTQTGVTIRTTDHPTFRRLLAVALNRFPGKYAEPLPRKTWDECFLFDEGYWMLHYHIEGDQSSKMEFEKL